MAVLEIDIAVEAEGWPGEDELAALCERTAVSVLGELGFSDAQTELSVLFTDDAAIAGLNARWRGKEGPTNVLSFPSFEVSPGDAPPPMLGDIVLALETISREADMEGKAFDHHLTHLLVHGLLHLLGYDHQDSAEADLMEGCERRILAGIGIDDPYR